MADDNRTIFSDKSFINYSGPKVNSVSPEASFEPQFLLRNIETPGSVATQNTKPVDNGGSNADAVKTASINFGESIAPQIFQSPHTILRVFWVLAYIGLIGIFTFQFYSLVDKYMKYPVVTQITIDRRTQSDFPAVTFCNNNPVRKSELEKRRNFVDLASLDEYVESRLLLQISEDYGYDWDLECPNGFEECPQTGVSSCHSSSRSKNQRSAKLYIPFTGRLSLVFVQKKEEFFFTLRFDFKRSLNAVKTLI